MDHTNGVYRMFDRKSLTTIGIGTFAALLTSPVLAQATDAPRYGHHAWDGPWHGWFMGPFMMIFFLAVIVVVVVLLVRWLGGHGPGQSGPHHASSGRSPLDILKERFAKGEIDKAEFEERRGVLGE